MQTTEIRILITPQDFDLLSDMQMKWWDEGWMTQVNDGRFEDTEIALSSQSMKWAYWFDSPINCILAKSYLESNKKPFKTTYDLHSESWVIFTNYATNLVAV